MNIEKILKIIIPISFLVFLGGVGIIFYAETLSVTTHERYEYGDIGAIMGVCAFSIFILSGLLLLRIKNRKIFSAWLKFALWHWGIFTVVSIFALIIDPDSFYGRSGGIGDPLAGISAPFFYLIPFLVISFIIVLAKRSELRGK